MNFKPIPTPQDDESQDDFISRCMADPTMRREYSSAQRYAICSSVAQDNKGSIKTMKKAIIQHDGESIEKYFESSRNLEDWLKSHSGDDGVLQEDITLFPQVKVESKDSKFEWTLSDYSLDRDIERLDPQGWDLENYKNNPVVLWMHNHSLPAIGKMTNVRVEDDNLVGDIEFDESDEFATTIKRKIEGGFITSGSVGFSPQRIEWVEEDDTEEDARLIFRSQELREFSIVNIPSNVNARTTASKSSPVKRVSYLSELFEKKSDHQDTTGWNTTNTAPGLDEVFFHNSNQNNKE